MLRKPCAAAFLHRHRDAKKLSVKKQAAGCDVKRKLRPRDRELVAVEFAELLFVGGILFSASAEPELAGFGDQQRKDYCH